MVLGSIEINLYIFTYQAYKHHKLSSIIIKNITKKKLNFKYFSSTTQTDVCFKSSICFLNLYIQHYQICKFYYENQIRVFANYQNTHNKQNKWVIKLHIIL